MRFPQEIAKNKSIPKDKIQGLALSAFCQGLLASAEFRYLN